jgi:type I restriction enzyme S subunit
MVLIRPDKRRLDFSFLCHWLNSPIMAAHIHGYRDGTVAERLNLPTIRALPILIPPLAEQKAIAAVLGALDDKIELNRRMNATLETMARALFQSWFVDFDPVRAKLHGRPPAALDPATAALFPEHLEDSPLGHIPKGWEVCSLANKIELLSGGTPKTSEPDYWNGDIPWYSVKDAPSETDVWVIQTDKQVTKLGIENSAAQVLPEGTTIISARGTVGKLALVGTQMAINQSCYGVRGAKGYADYFTYFALRQATADLQQRTHGTVFDTITRQTFETLDCIFPPAPLTQAFDRTVAPLLVQIRASLYQSRTLATLRDTLLPKLLSGELSVNETH